MYVIVDAKTRENVINATFKSLFGAYNWADCIKEQYGEPCLIEYYDDHGTPRGEWDLYAPAPSVKVNYNYHPYEAVTIDNKFMGALISYMDNDLREDLHNELCGYTNEQFLYAYVESGLDKDFNDILENEFELEVRLV